MENGEWRMEWRMGIEWRERENRIENRIE